MEPNSQYETVNISYAASGISLDRFYINKAAAESVKPDSKITFNVEGKIETDPVNQIVKVTMSYRFYDSEKTNLFEIGMTNEFKITGLDYSQFAGIQDDEKFIAHLAEVSLHHARGVQGVIGKGNLVSRFFIPVSPKINMTRNKQDLPSSKDE